MGKGERIIVAVEKGSSSKDAVKWTLNNKARGKKDVLCLLHIVNKITNSNGTEQSLKDVDSTSYMNYVENIVYPMLHALNKLVDNSISVELKVEKYNSIGHGIIEEARKFKATILVTGSPVKSMFGSYGRSSAGSIGSYCLKHRPPNVTVYVIQKSKIAKKAEPHLVTPAQSGIPTPVGSGRFSPEPFFDISESMNDSINSTNSNLSNYSNLEENTVSRHQINQSQTAQYDSEKLLSPARSSSNSNGSADITEEDSFPMANNYRHEDDIPTSRFGCLPLSPYRSPSQFNHSIAINSHNISHSNHSNHTSNYLSSESTPNIHLPRTFKLTPTRSRYKENSRYSKSNGDCDSEYDGSMLMSQNGSRIGTPHRGGEYQNGESPLHRNKGNRSPLSAAKFAAWGFIRRPSKEEYSQTPSRVLESKLMRMKKKAEEAEIAREMAELKAQNRLEEAERLLKEVEEQSSRREKESMARIEQAKREAEVAIAAAKEQQEIARAEAEKREEALKEVELHRALLEEEMRRRAEAEERALKEEEGISLRHFRKYTWEELQDATENFSPERKLGEGGYGTVFSGKLHHTPVAVKVLKNSNALQAENEFHQEVEVLGQIQHPHMVMLLGCCPERHSLVYEFMANGNLEERIACKHDTPPLPWYVRMRIAAEVASALLILHSRPVPIVHRDLKPANILLDKNLVAKLGDVGLARLMPGLSPDQTYLRESTPVGTFRYVDPEFQRTGEFGTKSDVYAFGIVLLDMLTGIGNHSLEDVEMAAEQKDEAKLEKLLDPKAGIWPPGMAMEVASLAVRCAEMRRRQRPDLEEEVMPLLEKFRTYANLEEDRQRLRRFPSTIDTFHLSSLICPITQEMMVNPVMAADGHTYEYAAIKHWLESDKRSPLTNLVLPHKELVPNHAVRSLIAEWQERINNAF